MIAGSSQALFHKKVLSPKTGALSLRMQTMKKEIPAYRGSNPLGPIFTSGLENLGTTFVFIYVKSAELKKHIKIGFKNISILIK